MFACACLFGCYVCFLIVQVLVVCLFALRLCLLDNSVVIVNFFSLSCICLAVCLVRWDYRYGSFGIALANDLFQLCLVIGFDYDELIGCLLALVVCELVLYLYWMVCLFVWFYFVFTYDWWVDWMFTIICWGFVCLLAGVFAFIVRRFGCL